MPSASSSKGGFTLFELLLVIVLIAVLYGVFINKLTAKREGNDAVPLTIETIGTFLKPFADASEKEASLVCLDACRECRVYTGGEPVDGDAFTLFEGTPTVYRRDEYGQFREVEFLPVKDDEEVLQDVCFRYTRYRNGSGSSYIVGYNDVFYLFDAYLQPVTKYGTLEAAAAAYNKADLLPDDERLYTF